MAKAVVDDEVILIDCFNNGRIIFESEIKDLEDKSHQPILEILHATIDSETIIKRVLRNLINAYKEKKDTPNLYIISELLTDTPWK